MRERGPWLLVGLAIGLLAGWLLGAVGEDAAVPGADLEADLPERASDPSQAPTLRTAAGPVVAPGQPAADAALTSGTGVIQGTVLDVDGAPLAGVVVMASPRSIDPLWEQRPGHAPPAAQTPEGTAAAAHRRALAGARTSRRVETDAQGRYRLGGLAVAPFTVRAWKTGYQVSVMSENRGWEVTPDAQVDFRAEGVVTVHLEVLRPDGGVPERASITAYPRGKTKTGGRRHVWTPARPWMDLPPGSYEFEASTEGTQAAHSPRVPLIVERGSEARPVLQLGGRPGLVGSLHFREPIVHQRTQVHALRLDEGAEYEPEVLFDRRRQKKMKIRPERGRLSRDRSGYTFKDLAPGRWLVGLTLDGQTCQVSDVVEITDRRVVHDFDIPAFDRGVFLEIRVVNRRGEPIPKVRLQHQFEAPTMSLGGGGRRLALASGSYLLERATPLPRMPPGREIERLPDGTHTLTVMSRELGQTSLVFDPSARGPLEVVLDSTSTLSLDIRGRERLPPGTAVHLCDSLPNEVMGLQSASHELPAEGPITLEQVQPGERLLAFLSHPAKGRQRAVLIVVPVEIRAGDERLVVTIPALRRLTITGLSGSGVSLRRLDPAGNWLQQIVFDKPDAEGRTVLEYVPDGRYEIGYTASAQRTTTWQRADVGGADVTVAIKR